MRWTGKDGSQAKRGPGLCGGAQCSPIFYSLDKEGHSPDNRVAPLPQSAPEALLNSFLFKRIRLVNSEYLLSRSQKRPGHYWVPGKAWTSRFISLNFRLPLRAAIAQGCCRG